MRCGGYRHSGLGEHGPITDEFHKFDNDGDVSNREAAQASAGAVDCGRLISARYGDEST